MTAEGRARLLLAAFERVRKAGLRAAGVLETTVGEFAFGSTTGLRHRFTITAASLRFFALDETGRIAGFAGGLHRDVGAIDVADVCETAVKKCLDGRDPIEI